MNQKGGKGIGIPQAVVVLFGFLSPVTQNYIWAFHLKTCVLFERLD